MQIFAGDLQLLNTATNNLIASPQIKVSPNPAMDFIELEAGFMDQLFIIDVNGRKIKDLENENWINVSDLNAGIYFIVGQNNKDQFIQSFVKI